MPDIQNAPVRVIRSARRKKTVEARMDDGVLELRVPQRCTQAEEAELIEHFRGRFERARRADAFDLERRAEELADEFGLPKPTSIRWVSNQQRRWGSCTPSDGSIRLSDRMTAYPRWVIDYVIVHELAHLVEFHHGPAFEAIVSRFPKAERARGYLLAKADGL